MVGVSIVISVYILCADPADSWLAGLRPSDHVGGNHQVLEVCQPPPRFHKMLHTATDPTPDPIYNPLHDNSEVSVPSANLIAIHTPGHCPDHLCYYFPQEKALFAGDCILGHGTTVFQDLKEYVDSLKKLSGWDVAKIYPAHGPVIENGAAKIEEYIKHRQVRWKDLGGARAGCTSTRL